MERNNDRIQITELFMAKAGNDWSRCYYGTIRRETDDEGNPVVYGKIKIGEGYIIARAKDQWELGEKLDVIVFLILEYNIHTQIGKQVKTTILPQYLN